MQTTTFNAIAAILAADATIDGQARKATIDIITRGTTTTPAPDRLLTPREVGAAFNRSPRSVQNWRKRGLIHAVKVNGRTVGYSAASVEALLARAVGEG